MPLYIYRSPLIDKKPEPPTVFINGCGDTPVKNQDLYTSVLLSGNQSPQKALFQVTDTKGYLILGCGTAHKMGYVHFPG